MERVDVSVTQLTDEELDRMRPAVRGLFAQRLEALWQECEAQLAEGERTDPRWAELMVRIHDRQVRLHRVLADEVAEVADEAQAADVARANQQALAARVSAGLDQMEARNL